MESLVPKNWRRLTMAAASVQLALPTARQYMYIDSMPLYTSLRTVQYIRTEISTVKLSSADRKEFTEVHVNKAFRIPDYPLTFVLEAYGGEFNDLYGWIVLRMEYIPDGIRLHEKTWVPNKEFDLPSFTLFDFEVIIDTPDHYFPGKHDPVSKATYSEILTN